MAPPTPIGLDFSRISNATLDINIPTSASEILPAMIQNANTATNNNFSIIIMIVMWVILFWITNDKTPFAEFKYSDARAAAISMGITSVMGVSMLEAGIFTNFRHVIMFGLIFVLLFIFIISYEDRG